jgi:6-phosphogluconolactonase
MPAEMNPPEQKPPAETSSAGGLTAAREVAPGVLVCPDEGTLARAAARLFVEWAWQAIARDGKFCVALSGGKTPVGFFRMLAAAEFRSQVDWPRVQIFWGDERPVPPESPESNYGLARRELLIRVPLPGANVHRMEAERTNIGRAAQDYEEILRANVPLDDRGLPRFHLIVLGLGPEGHTASLFPGQAASAGETSRWVSTPWVPQTGGRRMTMTLRVINASERVLFLVAGIEKAEPLYRLATDSDHDRSPLPAQLVKPIHGTRTILCDEAAASKILDELRARGSLRTPEK